MPCEPPNKQAGRTWNGRIEMQSTANLPSTVTWRCLSLRTLFGDAKGGVWWDAFPPSPQLWWLTALKHPPSTTPDASASPSVGASFNLLLPNGCCELCRKNTVQSVPVVLVLEIPAQLSPRRPPLAWPH